MVDKAADSIGTLAVDVTADTNPTLTALESLEGRLKTLADQKTVIKVDAGNLQTVVELITAAREEMASFGKASGEKPLIKIEGKIVPTVDSKQIRAAIEEALKPVFKINVEIGNLDEIKQQLAGLSVPIEGIVNNVRGAAGGVAFSHQADTSRLRGILENRPDDPASKINALYSKVSSAFSKTEKPLRAAVDAVDQLLSISERFGTGNFVDPKVALGAEGQKLKPAELRALRGGSLGPDALEASGITDKKIQSSIKSAAAEVQRVLKQGSAADADIWRMVSDAISGGGPGAASAAPIIVMASAEHPAITVSEASPKTVQTANTVLQKALALQAKRREQDAAEAKTQASLIAPVDLTAETKRLLRSQERPPVSGGPGHVRGLGQTDLARNEAEIAKKRKFLTAQEEKLATERENPVGEDLAKEQAATVKGLELSITNARSSIARLERRGESLRAAPSKALSAEDRDAQQRSQFVPSLAYGTVREGDKDLTGLLELANRGQFKHLGIEQQKRGDPSSERTVRLNREQERKLTGASDFRSVGGRQLKPLSDVEAFLQQAEAQHGPEARALAEKSLAEEGDQSPVRRSLRGILLQPSRPTALGGEPLVGRSGAGGNRDAGFFQASKPTAASEAEFNDIGRAFRTMRESDPEGYRLIRTLLGNESLAAGKANRDRVEAGRTPPDDRDLDALFDTKGKRPFDKTLDTLVHAAGIRAGQESGGVNGLPDPAIFTNILDTLSESDRPARGNFDRYGNFRPGALQQKAAGVVQGIFDATPENTGIDASQLSLKQMAQRLRRTKTTFVSEAARSENNPSGILLTDLSYLSDALLTLPSYEANRNLFGTQEAARLTDTGREGVRTPEKAADRALRTPAQITRDKQRTQAAALRRAIALVKDQDRPAGAENQTKLAFQNGVLGIEQPEEFIPGLRAGQSGPGGKAKTSDKVKTTPDATSLRGLIGDDEVYRTLTSLVAGSGMDARGIVKIVGSLKEQLGQNITDRAQKREALPGVSLYDRGGKPSTVGRNLIAPETEQALSYIAAQSGARFKVQLPTEEPRGTGLQRGTSTRKSLTEHFTSPLISEVIPPELSPEELAKIQPLGTNPKTGKAIPNNAAILAAREAKLPTGKALLSGEAFDALKPDVQSEVKALIEKPGGGYRGIGQIGQPETTENRAMTTGDQVRAKYATGYPGKVPGVENPSAASGASIIAAITSRVKDRQQAETVHAALDRAEPRAESTAEPRRSINPGEPMGAGPIDVRVISSVPIEIAGASGGGGGGGTPPAPPSDEYGEPTGRPRKNTGRTTGLKFIEPATRAESTERARKTRAVESMYARMFSQIEGEDRTKRRNVVSGVKAYNDALVVPQTRDERQSTYEKLFDQMDRRDNYQVRNGVYGPKTQKIGRLDTRNADLLAQEQDSSQDQLSEVRAKLRRANRSVPKRGFGASITDLITSFAGGQGFENQLESLGRAENEAGELQRLVGRRSQLRTQSRVLNTQLAATTNPQEQAALKAQLVPVRKELEQLSPAIQRSTVKFKENVEAVTKASVVAKSFGAAAIGGIASTAIGSITTGLGFAVTGPLIAGISEGLATTLGPTLERALGNPETTSRIVGQADQLVTAAGGRRGVEESTFAQSLNLTAEQGSLINGPILNQAEIEQGNKNFAGIGDAIRAFARLERTGPQGIGTGTGGFLGSFINQNPGTAQILGGIVAQDIMPAGAIAPPAMIPEPNAGAITEPVYTQSDINNVGPGINQQPVYTQSEIDNLSSPDAVGKQIPNPALKTFQANLDISNKTLNILNESLKRGGEETVKFTNDTSKLSQAQRDQQEQAIRLLGPDAAVLADQVKAGNFGITENGQAVTDTARINEILQDFTKGLLKPDLNALLGQNKDQIKAQFQTEDLKASLTREQIQPAQFAIEQAANPIGSATSGIARQDQKRASGALGEVKSLYADINTEQEQGITQAKAFVGEWLTGSAAVGQFSQALGEVSKLGSEISKIEIGRETVHAEYAAQQYNFQIRQVGRSLNDARNTMRALNGETAAGLGAIQGQQIRLQRELTQLGFQQTQRQINFQTAVAGFSAPGVTPEEREANVKAAKEQAKYAQEQLNIQKQLFGLEGKSIRISIDRSITDLTTQLGLLKEGRTITIDDAIAQKKIKGLTVQLNKEVKIVNSIFDQAQTRANDMLDLAGKFAGELGQDAAKVFKQIIGYYREFYDNLPIGGGSSGYGSGKKMNASGFLGTVSGATEMVMGEAGDETVAILRNPRNVSPSGMGGGSIGPTINFNGDINVRSEADIDLLVRKTVSALGRDANLRGLRLS